MFLLGWCRLQGRSQTVQEELVKLGEQMVTSSEGTRAVALELCREFEERFLMHIAGGEVSSIYFSHFTHAHSQYTMSILMGIKHCMVCDVKRKAQVRNMHEKGKRHPIPFKKRIQVHMINFVNPCCS